MSSFVLKPLSRPDQAWDVARVRNSGRQFLTHDQHEITEYEQSQWFQQTYIPQNLAGGLFVFVGYDGPAAVAYGLVKRNDDGRLWLTGVVSPDAQGKGYGRELFKFLTEFALHRAPSVWLDVFETNEKAIKLYESLGFELTGTSDNKFVMVKYR